MCSSSTQQLRELRRQIGARLQTARRERRLRLRELASLSGIAVEKLDDFELGRRGVTLEQLATLSTHLRLPLAALLP